MISVPHVAGERSLHQQVLLDQMDFSRHQDTRLPCCLDLSASVHALYVPSCSASTVHAVCAALKYHRWKARSGAAAEV